MQPCLLLSSAVLCCFRQHAQSTQLCVNAAERFILAQEYSARHSAVYAASLCIACLPYALVFCSLQHCEQAALLLSNVVLKRTALCMLPAAEKAAISFVVRQLKFASIPAAHCALQ
jgi:hypothetical protein